MTDACGADNAGVSHLDGLPTEYARAREQRRRAQAWTFGAFVVVLDGAATLKAGIAALLVLPAVVVAFLTIATIARSRSASRVTRSWSAQIPASLARAHGAALRGQMRATTELTGRLQVADDCLKWQPSAGSARLGATTLMWPLTALADASITPLWGVVPMSLVHINDRSGAGADVWVRGSAAHIISVCQLAGTTHS